MPSEMEEGKWRSGVEWNSGLRCKSSEQESLRRTHQCKFTQAHIDRHRCICGRAWDHDDPQ